MAVPHVGLNIRELFEVPGSVRISAGESGCGRVELSSFPVALHETDRLKNHRVRDVRIRSEAVPDLEDSHDAATLCISVQNADEAPFIVVSLPDEEDFRGVVGLVVDDGHVGGGQQEPGGLGSVLALGRPFAPDICQIKLALEDVPVLGLVSNIEAVLFVGVCQSFRGGNHLLHHVVAIDHVAGQHCRELEQLAKGKENPNPRACQFGVFRVDPR